MTTRPRDLELAGLAFASDFEPRETAAEHRAENCLEHIEHDPLPDRALDDDEMRVMDYEDRKAHFASYLTQFQALYPDDSQAEADLVAHTAFGDVTDHIHQLEDHPATTNCGRVHAAGIENSYYKAVVATEQTDFQAEEYPQAEGLVHQPEVTQAISQAPYDEKLESPTAHIARMEAADYDDSHLRLLLKAHKEAFNHRAAEVIAADLDSGPDHDLTFTNTQSAVDFAQQHTEPFSNGVHGLFNHESMFTDDLQCTYLPSIHATERLSEGYRQYLDQVENCLDPAHRENLKPIIDHCHERIERADRRVRLRESAEFGAAIDDLTHGADYPDVQAPPQWNLLLNAVHFRRHAGRDAPQIAVDNATGAVVSAAFCPEEDTRGCFMPMRGMINVSRPMPDWSDHGCDVAIVSRRKRNWFIFPASVPWFPLRAMEYLQRPAKANAGVTMSAD